MCGNTKALIASCGREVVVGSRVRLLNGRNCLVKNNPTWCGEMDSMVGNEYVVSGLAGAKDEYLKLCTLEGKATYLDLSYAPEWLELAEPMTKEEWIKALLDGAIGIQSGNREQRWRYNTCTGKFESKWHGDWKSSNDINMVYNTRDFSLEKPQTEMTIADIEKALGVTNLKVVK